MAPEATERAQEQRRGGVTVFTYRVIAQAFSIVRRNEIQQNVLLLLIGAYVVVGIEILNIANFNAETAKAVVGTLEISDLIFLVPALTMGTWAASILVVLASLGFSQFFTNGWEQRKQLSRSRLASLYGWGLVMLGAAVGALLVVPRAVAAASCLIVLLVAVAPREKNRPYVLGERDHHSGTTLSLRAALYAAMFGTPAVRPTSDGNAADDHASDGPDTKAAPLTADGVVTEYFDPGGRSFWPRQGAGLLLVLLLASSVGYNLAIARPWVPNEAMVITAPSKGDPAFDLLKKHSSAMDPDTAPFPNARVLVGRVFDLESDSLLVLTGDAIMVRVPARWVKARTFCTSTRDWWERSVISAGTYAECP